MLAKTAQSQAKFLEQFRKHGTITAAARAANMDPSSHYQWLRLHPEYRAAFAEAEADAVALAEDVLRDMAIKRKKFPALLFFLRCKRPDVYGRKAELRHTGNITIKRVILDGEEDRPPLPPAEPPADIIDTTAQVLPEDAEGGAQ